MTDRAESRLDGESRTKVPDLVRRALSLSPGDMIAYEVRNGLVVMRPAQRATSAHLAELDHVFADWSDPSDDAAFAYLSSDLSGHDR